MKKHSTRLNRNWLFIPTAVLIWVTAACQSNLLNPPRLATATAAAQATATPSPEPINLPAPTATPGSLPLPDASPIPPGGPNPELTIWINETSPAHRQVLQEMVNQFEAQSQIGVETVFVSPLLLPQLMETAVLSNTLPDIVLHPLAFTIGWAERGILDPTAAGMALDELGRETFNPDALNLVILNDETAALPSDGFHQILVYRKDWFDERGLAPPNTFERMMAAAEAVFDPEAFTSGLVIPTQSNLITTHQAFEQFAVANGCQLIDEKGEVQLLETPCQEAMDFYFTIIHNFSPIGVQTDTSARNAYLAGRTGFIITSPSILPILAGADEAALPSCAECNSPDYLAKNSGILTRITGEGENAIPASFGDLTNLGITTAADRETAVAFARYWFTDGYADWLSVESERKVPMRWGTLDRPREFIDAWGTSPLRDGRPSLIDIYGIAVVRELSEGIASSDRWAFRQGQGGLLSSMIQENIMPIVLQEMLSGYFGTEQTLQELYQRVTDLIPNYQYNRDTEANNP